MYEMTRRSLRRTVGRWSLSALGLLLLLGAGARAFVTETPAVVDVAGVGLPFGIGIGLVAAGLWLQRTRSAERIAGIARWALVGACLGYVVTAWLEVVLAFDPTAVGIPNVLTLNLVAVATSAGAAFGYSADERRERTRELGLSDARFRALTENVPFAVLTADESGTIRYANDTVTDVFGHDPADLVGEHITTLAPERHRQRYRDRFAECVSGDVDGRERECPELVGRRADGEEFPADVTFGEYADGDDRLYTGVVRDVTEQREAERRLQEHTEKVTRLHEITSDIAGADSSEAVYRRLVDGTADLFDCTVAHVAMADGDRLVPVASSADEPVDGYDPIPTTAGYAGRSYRCGTVLRVDDLADTRSAVDAGSGSAADARSGPSADAVAGPSADTVSGLSDDAEAGAPTDAGAASSAGGPTGGAYRSLLSVPFDGYGVMQVFDARPGAFTARDEEVAEMLAMHVNVALERAEAEETVRRERDRLEEFASVLSHDIRNPLNVAQGRVELAKETGEWERHADAIEEAHRRISRLIDDVLTLARQGRAVGATEPVSLDDVADLAWDTVATDDATLRTDSLGRVEADPSRLRQVFENLYRNAIEHGGDDVVVTVGRTERGFYVEDDGPGIPEGDRDRVFESGYSTDVQGTGFGLAIVKRIVEAHGWSVSVGEGTDGGTRFDITGVDSADR